jgi:hypothetical protein
MALACIEKLAISFLLYLPDGEKSFIIPLFYPSEMV